MKPDILFISAGAGSGKTHRITDYLFQELAAGRARPEAVIATTFTRKAASELIERVRQRLAEGSQHRLANSMGQALIGTVNSVCGRLLARYAFEAGLSPDLQVLDEAAATLLFSQAVEQAVELADIDRMNALARRLGQEDWKGEVRKVIDMARSNNLSPDDLPAQAERSLAELLAFFPKPVARDLDATLQAAVDQAMAGITGNGDETKVTATYLELLRSAQRDLTHRRFPWSEWVKLSKTGPGKRSAAAAEPVLELALCFDRHPGLHRDMGDWTRAVFALAAKAMATYRQFKDERGLMDFIDQEQQVLHLLDLPDVADSLREELDLLLVDEFQDTSPIQLAVFLKLATLAKKSVWVGDVKQAIYGFRGCDPELMAAVVRGLRAQEGAIEILEQSWRSRPQLVHLINDLFTPAFASVLQPEQVKLSPVRPELASDAALEFWLLEGKNQGLRAQALAAGVAALFAENRQVVDKQSGQLRPLRFGDVALLSRTNVKAVEYAGALAALGLPVGLGQAGLLATPEAVLALACLRRLADAGDSLASAEIVALHGSTAPEEWLENRLEYLAAGGVSGRWGVDGHWRHPVLAALETERGRLDLLSPSEALGRAIWAGEVERAVRAWGPTTYRGAQRLANLEALRGYAAEYENICAQQRSAATVGGLLLWLYELQAAELDAKGEAAGADAIQVLTHHRAKGLEWPVVICADLESKIRSGLWGLSMTADRAEIDMTDPLAQRRLNYWAWPFGKQSSDIAVADAIEASPAGEADREKQVAEAKRLLYVSLTRARDLLVMPLPANATSCVWLECLEADWLEPTAGELVLPGGDKVLCRTRSLSAPESVPMVEAEDSFLWFPPHQPRTPKLPAMLSPSSVEAVDVTAKVGRMLPLGSRLAVGGKPDFNLVGTAIHDLIAADLSGGLNVNREARANELLARYGLAAHLDAGEILARAQELRQLLVRDFGARAFYPEWPIESFLRSGQRLKGWIDLLVDTPEGWLIIDHKSFPGSRAEWPEHALGYSGQLAAYRQAVQQGTGRPVLSQWIDFCVGGGLVAVVFERQTVDSMLA